MHKRQNINTLENFPKLSILKGHVDLLKVYVELPISQETTEHMMAIRTLQLQRIAWQTDVTAIPGETPECPNPQSDNTRAQASQ